MENSKKRRFVIAFTIITFTFLILLFSPLNDSVRAFYDKTHAVAIFLRFDAEILEKSSAGPYYRGLLIKHGEEQYQIVNAHPEHLDEFWQVVDLFTLGIEALVNGEGDTVRITEEQINRLKEEWEWEAQFASESFREDIEKELERFPLDNFVGMTVSEAWGVIDSSWSSDPPATVETAPAVVVTATPFPKCYFLPDSDCSTKLPIVPNTNDLWVYHNSNKIYFEAPGNWNIQKGVAGPEVFYFYMIPPPESPEDSRIKGISLIISNLVINNSDPDEFLRFPQMVFTQPISQWENLISHTRTSEPQSFDTHWKQSVYLIDFQGIEILWKEPSIFLEAFLYNKDEQIAIFLLEEFQDPKVVELIDNPSLVENFSPSFQHIMESIQLWKP
ncbi:hypothetical protein [Candidatus Villigracilis affinis]|uniref:hypothetical protein n=1 Tax=Candidatus Villigracilis affinis TaxID=3140682 RepID=UPI001DCA189E|nr:hypothetical protein [Anaerolineales bacterium]